MNKPRIVLHGCIVAILISYICSYFFLIKKYQEFPWWHEIGNDIDVVQTASNLSLINGAPFTLLHHPAATPATIHILSLRIGSLINKHLSPQLTLTDPQSLKKNMKILAKQVIFHRYINLLWCLCFAMLSYFLFFRISNSLLLSFFFSFFIISNKGFLEHIVMIRPELPNVTLFFLTLLISLNILNKSLTYHRQNLHFLLLGFTFSLSFYTKIQILPALAIYLLFLLFYAFKNNAFHQKRTFSDKPFLMSYFFHLLIFPWFSFIKPQSLSSSFFANLPKNAYEHIFYGANPPDSFLPALILAFFLPLFIYLFIKLKFKAVRKTKMIGELLISSLTHINYVLIGTSLAFYIICLNLSTSWTHWIENMQRLNYTVLSLILNGGGLRNVTPSFNNILQVIQRLDWADILNINLFYFLLVLILVSIYRSCSRAISNKSPYHFTLILILIGFLSDFLSTLRGENLYSYYFIYALTFYTPALVIFVKEELTHLRKRPKLFTYSYTLLSLIFIFHILFQIKSITMMPQSSTTSYQDPSLQLRALHTHNKNFFSIIKEYNPKTYRAQEQRYKTKTIWKEWEAYLVKQLNQSPEDAQLHHLMGLNLYYQKDYSKAFDFLNKALSLDQTNSDTYRLRADIYNSAGKLKLAVQDYLMATELNPNNFNAFNNLGNTYKSLQQWEKAVQTYTTAIDINPQIFIPYFNRAIAYEQLNQWQLALKDYDEAAALKPDFNVIYNNRGIILKNSQQYAAALENYNQALKLNPQYAEAYFNRANVYFLLKEYDKSLNDFQKASNLGIPPPKAILDHIHTMLRSSS